MTTGSIFVAGTKAEVQHHVEPLSGLLPLIVANCEKIVEQARPGDLAIFFSEHFDQARDCIKRLKENNVATLYALDGILEWRNAWENEPNEPACPWTMRPVLSHRVACIGPSQARILSDWGNFDKVELVGVPRFDKLFHHQRLRNGSSRKAENEVPKILVTTAKCPGFTDSQRAAIIQSLHDLKQWFQSATTIRSQPVELIWRLSGELANQLGVSNTLNETTGEELVELIKNVDAVITTPSTVQLESMILSRPTAMLDYTNSPAYVDAAWRVSSREHLECVIPQLLEPTEPRMLHQQSILQDAIVTDGKSSERMHELIKGLLQRASSQSSEGKNLCLDKPILGPIDCDSRIKISHPDCFPGHNSFEQRDLLTLQAELGHARREILHLQNEIKSCQSELAEAHQIFDQIHNHPIAGPVVRTRQKLIDWMTHFRQKNVEVESANVHR